MRRAWAESRLYRVLLAVVLVYALLRLGVQVMIVTSPDLFPIDLRAYLAAAENVRARLPLYLPGDVDTMEFYEYTPTFALAFVPFLWLPPVATAAIHSVLHLVVYALLFFRWAAIFQRLGLQRARDMLVWSLPVWLIFSEFWSDLGYLNVYMLMALLATLLLEAVLDGRAGWGVLWLSIILQMKPQWAFVVAVPLLLGRYRFFARLVAGAVAVYLAVAGITMLLLGPGYGWAQYRGYYGLLATLSRLSYPWRTLADGFMGYNHSIAQVVIYFLGSSPAAVRLALAVKLLLLLPLGLAALRSLLRPARCIGARVPLWCLDLTFALYLGAFIWLDQVWEVALGIVVFGYLLGTVRPRWVLALVWGVFMIYALTDLIRLLTFALLPAAVLPGPYFLTDPSVWVPVTLVVILTFYLLLVRRLWAGTAAPGAVEAV